MDFTQKFATNLLIHIIIAIVLYRLSLPSKEFREHIKKSATHSGEGVYDDKYRKYEWIYIFFMFTWTFLVVLAGTFLGELISKAIYGQKAYTLFSPPDCSYFALPLIFIGILTSEAPFYKLINFLGIDSEQMRLSYLSTSLGYHSQKLIGVFRLPTMLLMGFLFSLIVSKYSYVQDGIISVSNETFSMRRSQILISDIDRIKFVKNYVECADGDFECSDLIISFKSGGDWRSKNLPQSFEESLFYYLKPNP